MVNSMMIHITISQNSKHSKCVLRVNNIFGRKDYIGVLKNLTIKSCGDHIECTKLMIGLLFTYSLIKYFVATIN